MSAALSIRRVRKEAADALAALHRRCFSTPWSAASFESLLEHADTLALVASQSDAVRTCEAFIVTRVASDEAEILTLGTAPSMRRSGLGRALVLAASAEAHRRGAKEIFLEVAGNNAAAGALYAGIGFSVVGRRAGYYHDDLQAIDAMIMRARLPLAH